MEQEKFKSNLKEMVEKELAKIWVKVLQILGLKSNLAVCIIKG